MTALAPHASVKVVGANGQISLGKQLAGGWQKTWTC